MGWTGGILEPLFEPLLAQAAVRDMADDGGDWLLEKVIENTPVSYHGLALQHQGFKPARTPGTLKRSWRRRAAARVTQRGTTGMRVEVYTTDPVAPFVEEDTRPHVIRPKTAGGLLVFRLWPTGQLVRAKMVRHPGTRGAHMMLESANAAYLSFDTIARPSLERWRMMAARHAMQVNRGQGRAL